MKFALIQMPVSADKQQNLRYAAQQIAQVAKAGARVAVLPEMFCCPYDNASFSLYAEETGGTIWQAMSFAAKQNHITLVAGSMPEKEKNHLFNTSFVFDEQGKQIACHRKVHLFDINIEGGQRFMESDVLTPGCERTTFEVDGIRMGLCICFDIRFPELFRSMALDGVQAVIVPAAFNMTTGPMHWELTFRMRAVDNQLYTIGAAPARNEQSSYVSYANSIVCSPWGNVLARAKEQPALPLVGRAAENGLLSGA